MSFYIGSTYCVGSIILVNGTSSAGKSSIITHLKEILKEDAVFVSIDEIGWTPLLDEAMLRGLITCEMSKKEQYDVMYKNLDELCAACEHKLTYLEQLYERIQDLASRHRYVIFDTVFYMDDYRDVAFFWKKMESFDVYSILVYCAPQIIAQRVMQRNNEATDDQKRDLLSVINSFCLVYSPALVEQDIVDFLTVFDIEKLVLTMQKYLRTTGMSESLIEEKVALLSKEYRERFFSNAEAHTAESVVAVGIAAQFKHDLVINTGTITSEACAQMIAERFLSRKNLK